MNCPPKFDWNGRVSRARNVTFRPVPEWRRAFAYTPLLPQLTELNPTAWLIFELSDGRDLAALKDEFVAATASHCGADEAHALLEDGLVMLRDARLISIEGQAA